jgi:hypothetical protein
MFKNKAEKALLDQLEELERVTKQVFLLEEDTAYLLNYDELLTFGKTDFELAQDIKIMNNMLDDLAQRLIKNPASTESIVRDSAKAALESSVVLMKAIALFIKEVDLKTYEVNTIDYNTSFIFIKDGNLIKDTYEQNPVTVPIR